MNKKIKSGVITLCLGLSYIVNGQDYSPISLTINYAPQIDLSNRFVVGKINLSYPFLKLPDTKLLVGVNGRIFEDDIQREDLVLNDRYCLSVPLTMTHKLNDKYRLYCSFETGISSDFTNISSKSFKYSSNISLMRSDGDTTRWSVILLLTSQCGGLTISPSFYTNFRIYDRLYFNGVLPFRPRITWKANVSNYYGIALSPDMNTFYLTNDNKNSQFVKDSKIDIELFYQYRVFKNFKLSASIGHSVFHKAKVYEKYEKVPVQIYIFDNSSKKSVAVGPNEMVFKVSLFYSLSD
jgi:hypothetical protein